MQVTWEWLAGFFDGEGTARIGRSNSISPMWQLVQAGDRGERVIREVASFITQQGVKRYTLYSRAANYPGKDIVSRLECWLLQVFSREDVILIYRGMLPYLRVKKTDVQDILRYCILYPALNRGVAFKQLNKESGLRRRRPVEVLKARRKVARRRYYLKNKERIRAYQNRWRRARKLAKHSQAAD